MSTEPLINQETTATAGVADENHTMQFHESGVSGADKPLDDGVSSFGTDEDMQEGASSIGTNLKVDRKRAIIMISIAMILMQSYQALLKYGVNVLAIDLNDMLLMRPIVTMLFAFLWLKIFRIKRSSGGLGSRKGWMVALRFLVTPIAVLLNAYGTIMIPLTVRQSILNTRPFLIAFFGGCFLGESLECFEKISMVLSFSAIIFILLMSPGEEAGEEETEYKYLLGCGMIAVATLIISGFQVMVRTLNDLNPMFLVFMSSVILLPVQLVVTMTAAAVDDDFWRIFNYTGTEYLFIVGTIVLETGGLYCAVSAMQSERSGFIAMLTYVALVYAYLYDHFLFNAELSLGQILGIGFLFAVNMGSIYMKMSDPKLATKQTTILA